MTDRTRRTSVLVLAFVATAATSALAAPGEPPPGAAVPPPVKPAAPRSDAPAPSPTQAPAPAPAPPPNAAPDAAPPSAAPATATPAVAPASQNDEEAKSAEASAEPPPQDPSSVVLKPRELPSEPAAPERPNPNSIDDGEIGSHQTHWLVSIGWRQAFVKNAGLDPFSKDDSVPQFSLSAGRTLLASDKLSLVALALWDIGGLESSARGAKTSLAVNRLTLGAEGRYHIFRRFYAFGRVAPGALNWSASLDDATTGGKRTANAWSFATDLSAGAAFEFAGDNRGASTRPRAWVGFDGGYGFAGSSKVELEPEDDAGAPVRTEPITFADLAVRGPFIRFSLNGTY
jgi:hypothetical protein